MTRFAIKGTLWIIEGPDHKNIIAFEKPDGCGWYLTSYRVLPPDWEALMKLKREEEAEG